MALYLQASVGRGGVNRRDDVRALKLRLAELGFGFFAMSARADPDLVAAIRLFQSIIAGRNRVGGDGRVDPGYVTHEYLDAVNAPQWAAMPLSGPGFVNYEAQDRKDRHDYGTSWLAQVIRAAGAVYDADYLQTNPAATPMTINDASLPRGGDTPDHGGHETGLACDLRVPRRDGTAGGIRNPNTNRAYDRGAMRAQLRALQEQELVDRVFFNDRVLVGEGLCRYLAGHGDHVHFQILPPPAVASPGRA